MYLILVTQKLKEVTFFETSEETRCEVAKHHLSDTHRGNLKAYVFVSEY
jgi:hypothetical protein